MSFLGRWKKRIQIVQVKELKEQSMRRGEHEGDEVGDKGRRQDFTPKVTQIN